MLMSEQQRLTISMNMSMFYIMFKRLKQFILDVTFKTR